MVTADSQVFSIDNKLDHASLSAVKVPVRFAALSMQLQKWRSVSTRIKLYKYKLVWLVKEKFLVWHMKPKTNLMPSKLNILIYKASRPRLDETLWITERVGKNITRIDPVNGTKLSSTPVPNVHQSAAQDGLLGMAFDPNFNNTNYIYVAYTYDAADPGEELDRRTKITRFTYDPATSTISEPLDLISGLAGSSDHNSGRMTFGPDGNLYYTIADQGKNQLALFCLNNLAQHLPTAEQVAANNWTAYEGKVLRMNPDGSIPDDNPVIEGVKSHIFTYGHHNAQGIAVGPDGALYVAEHGDNSADEINRLQSGGNYGWPGVSGYNDNKTYQFYNWSAVENCEELTFNDVAPAPPGVPVRNESEFNATNSVDLLQTFYTVEADFNFTDAA
jgi:PQQ-dependent dehydrogenase (s-GDH family)